MLMGAYREGGRELSLSLSLSLSVSLSLSLSLCLSQSLSLSLSLCLSLSLSQSLSLSPSLSLSLSLSLSYREGEREGGKEAGRASIASEHSFPLLASSLSSSLTSLTHLTCSSFLPITTACSSPPPRTVRVSEPTQVQTDSLRDTRRWRNRIHSNVK
jgi:hypothetical protein